MHPLKIARARACLSVAELSKISGVAIATIESYESGRRHPYPITLGRLARALEIDVLDLVEEGDERRPKDRNRVASQGVR